VPYDVSLVVTGEENAPIIGAYVVLEEVGDETGTQITDEVGQAFWYNLPGETVSLSISSQGYFPLDMTESVDRGINQIMVALERDPHGLLPSEACAPGEKLLYIEDFQDGEAQGWQEIEFRAQGWDLGPHPDSPGDKVVLALGTTESWVNLQGFTFENAVARIQLMPEGLVTSGIRWYLVEEPYEFQGDTIEWSSYDVFFELDGINIHRGQSPRRSVQLLGSRKILRGSAWHNIEIITYDGKLEFWVDGARLLVYQDPRPLPGGALNLWVNQSTDDRSVVYFDDISVCELTAPYVPMPTPES
jgi:hypothetical protein